MAFRFFKRKIERPHGLPVQVPRALAVDDIMQEIYHWLELRDLVALTLTTRLWKRVAHEELWKTYATLDTLLFALPKSVLDINMVARRRGEDYIRFKTNLTPKHWECFRMVASKIQRLEQRHIMIRLATFKQFILYRSNDSPPSLLCPQIRTLLWTATDNVYIDAIKLFMSPSLRHVRFRLGRSMIFPDDKAAERILDGLSSVQPPLESLEIVSFLQYDYHPLSYRAPTTVFIPPTAFSAYPNLRSVHIPLHSFADTTLHHLPMLPYLDNLRFGILQSFPLEFGADVMTFRSLVTLGLNGSSYHILPLLNAINSPRLATFEFCSWGTDHDAILERFKSALVHRLDQISKTTLIMPYWDVGVDTVLMHCAAVAQDITFYGHRLSFPHVDNLFPNIIIQHLILRGLMTWNPGLSLTHLPDLLARFPSLTHIEIGLEAMNGPLDMAATPPYLNVQELVIFPGPINVDSTSTAAFLASLLPFATIRMFDFVLKPYDATLREYQESLTKWGEVIRIVPIIQRCLSVERHRQQTELQREISDLQTRLKLYESNSSA